MWAEGISHERGASYARNKELVSIEEVQGTRQLGEIRSEVCKFV